MNILKALVPLVRTVSLKPTVVIHQHVNICYARGITSLCNQQTTSRHSLLLPVSQTLNVTQPSRSYKVRTVLKKRCAGCYFEKRHGRVYVECSLKPRHKQMQQKQGMALYKDDYSKGNWKRAIHWGWKTKENFYKQGDNQFSRYKWLEGKIGTEI